MRPFLLGRSRAASFVRWHVQFHTGSYPKNGLTRKSHRKPLMDIARNGLQARKVSRWHIWDARPTAAVLTQPDVPKSEWTSLPDPFLTFSAHRRILFAVATEVALSYGSPVE